MHCSNILFAWYHLVLFCTYIHNINVIHCSSCVFPDISFPRLIFCSQGRKAPCNLGGEMPAISWWADTGRRAVAATRGFIHAYKAYICFTPQAVIFSVFSHVLCCTLIRFNVQGWCELLLDWCCCVVRVRHVAQRRYDDVSVLAWAKRKLERVRQRPVVLVTVA